LQQSRNEINGARARIKWLTANAEKYLSDEIMSNSNGMEEKISYEPLGVVCNISAWNYPYLVGVNVFIPALLAGNAVLYKPSEYAYCNRITNRKTFKAGRCSREYFPGCDSVRGVLVSFYWSFLLMVTSSQVLTKQVNISIKKSRQKWFPVNANWVAKILCM
jgi:hypothetical protein